MKYTLFGIVFVLLAGGVYFYYNSNNKKSGEDILPVVTPQEGAKSNTENVIINNMNLSSSKFEDGGLIPKTYTCDGKNISPPLSISGVPEKAKSLVLIIEDRDVPKSARPDGIWDHLVVFNIPVSTKEIGEGEKISGIYGKNTSGTNKYTGPCPPDREHSYIFYLYAIDNELSLGQDATKNVVLNAISGHIIEETKFIGRYDRVR